MYESGEERSTEGSFRSRRAASRRVASRRVALRSVAFPVSRAVYPDVYWPTARGASRRRTVLQAREAPRRPSTPPSRHPAAPYATPAAATMRLRHHPRRGTIACPRGGVVPPPTVTRRTLRGPAPYTCLRRREITTG